MSEDGPRINVRAEGPGTRKWLKELTNARKGGSFATFGRVEEVVRKINRNLGDSESPLSIIPVHDVPFGFDGREEVEAVLSEFPPSVKDDQNLWRGFVITVGDEPKAVFVVDRNDQQQRCYAFDIPSDDLQHVILPSYLQWQVFELRAGSIELRNQLRQMEERTQHGPE